MNQHELQGLVNIEALSRFLREQIPGSEAPLNVIKHQAGYSNETFYVTRGDERWVMRRPPRGELLPTSHDVLREYRVMSGLQGTVARVPRTVIACEDPSVIGAPFYLMERVDGLVAREELPAAFQPAVERRRLGEELIDTLVELHGIDFQSTPLADLGRPSGFLERQLRRWSSQLDLTLPRTRPLPGIAEITRWLAAHLPEQGPATIVHGDFKLDNVIYATAAPASLLAMLDWEMATLGDPFTDVAWCLSYWGPTGDPPEHQTPGSNTITEEAGFLTREELLARYEERSRRPMPHFQFYFCFAVWKYAIIIEGLYRHFLEGTAANQRAAEMEWRTPLAIERMHRIIAGRL